MRRRDINLPIVAFSRTCICNAKCMTVLLSGMRARRRDASRARRCVRRVTTKRAQPTLVGVDSCERAAVCPKLYSNYVLMNASRRFSARSARPA